MADMIGVGELKDMALWRAVAAEFIGTLLWIFSTIILYVHGGAWMSSIPAILGVCYAALVWAFRGHNAGHFNPVISLSALAFRKISVVRWVLYFCAQFLGAIVGAAFVRAMMEGQGTMRMGAMDKARDINDGQAFLIEFMGSLLIVLVYQETFWNPHTKAGELAPVAAGFAHIVAGTFTATFTAIGLNPVRAFASAATAVDGAWGTQWVGWVGPAVGAIVAILLGFVFGTHKGAKAVAPAHDDEKGKKMERIPPQ
eukprot:a676694_1223.p1 GENE.a676694_1223~~a676694_1223.p1  ORF type:complete len:267 (+),score=130.96 a676694_1223:39-803(+)